MEPKSSIDTIKEELEDALSSAETLIQVGSDVGMGDYVMNRRMGIRDGLVVALRIVEDVEEDERVYANLPKLTLGGGKIEWNS